MPRIGYCCFIACFTLLFSFNGLLFAQCPDGDINGDCTVNIEDIFMLADQWLDEPGCVNDPNLCADIFGQDGVNFGDFNVIANNWLRTGTAVYINEIHYNPDLPTDALEFVELYNLSVNPIDISGWYFSEGIEYTFPAGTQIAGRGYIIIAANPSAVTAKYGTPTAYGPFVGRLSNDGEKITLRDNTGDKVDAVDYQLGFPWPTIGDAVPDDDAHAGSGHSIQMVNPQFDNDLAGSWRSAFPTPGTENLAVYAENIPPHIRQVKHSPNQPTSAATVSITAKVTDPDGVKTVLLYYQIVDPGNYIPLGLPNNTPNYVYSNIANWIPIEMTDDGTNGDAAASDDIYTVQMPADMQINRRLIRYRITVEDNTQQYMRVPYADDPQPNFVYFCYDGVPAWSGAIKPDDSGPLGQVVEYGTDVMASLPVYHLISRNSDVNNCQWNSAYNNGDFRFYGTIVYDGVVYDHIRYRIRGQYSTFFWGKNKWKLNFNRGHYFQGRDNFGKKYKEKRNKINFGTGSCPWWKLPGSGDKGEAGMVMNEPLSFLFYNMAGVPSPDTNYFHFRVIDGSLEANPSNQYEGDFWGLYFAIEQPDGHFIDEHGLADGNLYKMDGSPAKMNQSATQVTDSSDVNWLSSNLTTSKPATWWDTNIDLAEYYSYNATGILINNSDRRYNQNCLKYHDPVTDKWLMLPWDLDLTFEYGPHNYDEPNWEHFFYSLSHDQFEIAYKNRARELQDLLFNTDQGWQVIDEMASVISSADGAKSFVDAERAMWNYHPRFRYSSAYYRQPALPTHDFAGLVSYMKTVISPVSYYGQFPGSHCGHRLNEDAIDYDIPDRTEIRFTGTEGFPVNDLTFVTSDFSDPQGDNTFAAMKWRIAEVEAGSKAAVPVIPPGDDETEILIAKESMDWKYFKAISGPPSTPDDEWRQESFNDNSWLEGQTSIGYGDNDDNTEIDGMRGNYTTIYLRKTFEVVNVDDIETLELGVYVDDGCIIWINGTEIARPNCSTENKQWNSTSHPSSYVNNASWQTIELASPYSYLHNGTNTIAIHVLNSSITSSDMSIDVTLTAKVDSDETGQGGLPDSSFSYRTKHGKYEIDTIWESQELTVFDDAVQIPASVVKPGRTYRVRCRMKDDTGRWSHWSDPNQFTTGQALSAYVRDYLRITEVMFNPGPADVSKNELDVDNDEFEFVELKNIGDENLDLTNLTFNEGIAYDFSQGDIDTLLPGKFLLLVKNKPAFESRYGTDLSSRITGQYSGSLSNSGENIKLQDYWNGTIFNFTYNDSRGWPQAADGSGHSMIPVDGAIQGEPDGTLEYCGNWKHSTYINGSPGADDPAKPAGIVINEVAAHTDYAVDPYDSNDWVELYNPTSGTINLNGNWYLSDDFDDLKKWPLHAASVSAAGFISFDEVNDFHAPITSGFGLDKAGEQIILSYLPGTTQDRVVDYVHFKGQENSVTLGRYPDGNDYLFAMTPTRDSANTAPADHLVIREIMYHPLEDSDNDEYLELYNTTSSLIFLEDWRIDSGVDFTFPAATAIGANDDLFVVGFDPAVETARLASFVSTYSTGSLVAGVDIVGPWSGNLSNGGERIAIERPLEPDLPDTTIPWVIVDEVIYGDFWPWPQGPDGSGKALQRISTSPTQSGSDPQNWQEVNPN
ncbi:MAG: lamin tail domain-containing protein [Anaerohalosphaera sp.]|nr:lamin tail domain-containing protein [Anaerohalosphaera sp.]